MKKTKIIEKIPAHVYQIGRVLGRAGEDAYLVGGAIRDILIGRNCTDFDMATTATPQKVERLFRHVIPTGIQHGTVTIMMGKTGYEVTTLRGDGAYSDGRRPDHVEYIKEIHTDLARRDFTMNAMAWDLNENRLHDPFDGEKDLENRIIRAVGDPRQRFAEDALRAMRAARFAATLGCAIEQRTADAIPGMSDRLARISAERKQMEMVRILQAEKPSIGLRIIESSGLLPYLCPNRNVFETDHTGHADSATWELTLRRVDLLPLGAHLRIAGLLLHNIDLEVDTPDGRLQHAWLREMKFEKKVTEAVTFLIKNSNLTGNDSWSDHQVRTFLRRVGRGAVFDVIELYRSTLASGAAPRETLLALENLKDRIAVILRSGVPLTVIELPVSGKTLIDELGLTPGPQIGQILQRLLDEVLRDPNNNTKQRLLQIAEEYLSGTSR